MANKTVKVENVHVEGLNELKKLSQDPLEQAEQLSNTIERFNQLKLIISTRNNRFIPENNDGIRRGNSVAQTNSKGRSSIEFIDSKTLILRANRIVINDSVALKDRQN